jgi:hypothetical protein
MPTKEPFKKPMKRPDQASPGKDQGSYQYGIEQVQVFNNNSVEKSPTTSSKTFKPAEKNQFLPRPGKYK